MKMRARDFCLSEAPPCWRSKRTLATVCSVWLSSSYDEPIPHLVLLDDFFVEVKHLFAWLIFFFFYNNNKTSPLSIFSPINSLYSLTLISLQSHSGRTGSSLSPPSDRAVPCTLDSILSSPPSLRMQTQAGVPALKYPNKQ